jgi:hypothetical protein
MNERDREGGGELVETLHIKGREGCLKISDFENA